MAKKIISILACLALVGESLISTVQTFSDQNYLVGGIYIFLFAFAVISFLLTIYWEFSGYIKANCSEKINQRLIDFICSSGETVIVSRDLSWINDAIKGQLREKVAKGDRLRIFLPEQTETSESIEEFAKVRYYGQRLRNAGNQLTSRFTIQRFGRDSAKLTYPQTDNEWHINSYYGHGDAAFTLATDIIKLLEEITNEGEEEGAR